jgi:LAGLIDADG DNA endonuclease family protein
VPEHPAQVRRRIVPDDAQIQVILGSLLGSAALEGRPGARRLVIAHDAARADYVWWKYERLALIADAPPSQDGDRIGFRTIAHPIFDELACLLARRDGDLSVRPGGTRVIAEDAAREEAAATIRALLRPLGLAVWMADAGRVEIRPELFATPRSR